MLQVPTHKHLAVILDEKLSFTYHLNEISDKCMKNINILRKLRNFLPRRSLLTIYKSFIRSQLDYADVIYDQPYNTSFVNKIESIQYTSPFCIRGIIRSKNISKLSYCQTLII